jgi:hypothetical protein
VNRPIPGAKIAYRKEVGSTGRRVALQGWMDVDYREAMSNLADNEARIFTDGKDTFLAKALKPSFDPQESKIDYAVEIVEVSE